MFLCVQRDHQYLAELRYYIANMCFRTTYFTLQTYLLAVASINIASDANSQVNVLNLLMVT